MTYGSGTIGGTQYAGPSSTYGNGTDYTSGFIIPNTDANYSGAVVSNVQTTDKPVLINGVTVYFRSSVQNNVELEMDSSKEPGGANRASSKVTNTDTSPTFDPNWKGLSGDTYYAGFRKLNGNTVNWYREAARSGLNNPGYNIYRDGAADGSFTGTSQYMRITWNTVPSAPASYTSSNITASSITLTWTAPAENGLGGTGSTGINGYRILKRKWTSGGTETWTPVLVTVSSGRIGTGSTLSYTITGLAANTPYEFLIAATNEVTDVWGTSYSTADATAGTNLQTSAIYTLSGPKVWNGSNFNTRSTVKIYDTTDPVNPIWISGVAKVWDGTWKETT